MNQKTSVTSAAQRIVAVCAAASAVLCIGTSEAADQPVVGLITKTDTNPFFVKMRQGAEGAAQKDGAKLMTAAGKFDGDNEAR
jgi:fructose transport system substrate-binding protein